jgi:hypothetical protein
MKVIEENFRIRVKKIENYRQLNGLKKIPELATAEKDELRKTMDDRKKIQLRACKAIS